MSDVLTALELAAEVDEIYRQIKEPLDRTPEGLKQELENRLQWRARSAEILADAKVILAKKKGEEAEKHLGTEEGWNLVKDIIASACHEEDRLYTLAERLNATLSDGIAGVITLLSYDKQERANSWRGQ